MIMKKQASVYLRYAVSHIFVVLVLFTAITGFLYVRTGVRSRESLIDDQINRLTRIANQHESNILSMLNTAEEISLSPDIDKFVYDEEPWKAYNLQLQLVPYTVTNTFCDKVYLCFSGDDRIYSSSSSMTLSLFTRLMQYEHVTEAQLTSYMLNTDQLTILPAQQITSSLTDASQIITFLVPLGSNPSTGKGVIMFLVKDSVYQNLFYDAIDGDINTYIYREDSLISCSEDIEFPWENILNSSDDPSGSIDWNGEKWTVVSVKNRKWGISYAAVMRDADISAAVAEQIFNDLAILPLFMMLSICLALLIAKWNTKPIRVLTSLLHPDKIAESSNEFQQISSGIKELTSQYMELSSRLELALPMQRHDFVFQFVKGRFNTKSEAVAAARNVGLEIDRLCYAAILCGEADGIERPFEFNVPPFNSLSDYSGVGVELVALKAMLYLVFSDDRGTLMALAEMIRSEGEACAGRCVTSISAVHTDFTEAPNAYLEAATAYDNRFAIGSQQILVYSDISSNIADVLPQSQKLTTSISQALAIGNRDLLEERINELLHLLRSTQMSPFAYRMIYSNAISTLAHVHASVLTNSGDGGDSYNILTLSSCQSIDELDELLRKFCNSVFSSSKKSDGTDSDDDEIGQVVRYMEEHFNDHEISMAAIADSFDLSTTRFSLSFKEKIGITPLEYLTLLRVEHAKDLLVGTDMSVRDVSLQVGYYDSGSFIRRFKQLTGETPLQYRRFHDSKKANDNTEDD